MKQGKRHVIQIIAAFIANANIKGFFTGTIWRGKSKSVCIPGLNCYSCPGALGACPVGSIQNALCGNNHGFPYYVFGLSLFFGVLLGRLICGFLCLFGLIQDLLYKIGNPKKKHEKIKIPMKADHKLRYLKYLVLVFFVILLPLLVRDSFGVGWPFFCKFLCPAGTLEAGIPLIATNSTLRHMIGFLFSWKMLVLFIVVVSSILIKRPFCKYLCPLGAFYGLFNRISFYRLKVNKNKCIECKRCEEICPMQVKVTKQINSSECIRCGACKQICPTHAIETCKMIGNEHT